MRNSVGWIYRTQGLPPYLEVLIGENKESFPDDKDGALAAVKWITRALNSDDWFLEEMGFLGYRIIRRNDV